MIKHKDDNQKCKGRRPARVAVTGGIGSGKTLVCQHLQKKGIVVISADELSRLAVAPGTRAYKKIFDHFGERVILPDKSINRQKLRRIISSSPEAKKTLESFIHPEVFRQMAERVELAAQNGEDLVVVEVPLLFESGFDAWFDVVVMVSVDRERRIARIMTRDEISREDAESMMKIQMSEGEKRRRADFVIDNNNTKEQTLSSVDRLYDHLMQISEKRDEKS